MVATRSCKYLLTGSFPFYRKRRGIIDEKYIICIHAGAVVALILVCFSLGLGVVIIRCQKQLKQLRGNNNSYGV